MTENSATKQIFVRRLSTYLHNITDRTLLGIIPDIMNILEKYNLSEYLHKYTTNYTFPTPAVRKRTLKNVLYQHQSKSFQEVVTSDSDFVRFKKKHNVIKPSVIWQATSTTAELKLMHFIIKSSVLIPRKSSDICQNCGLEFTDPINHIIT